MGKVKSIFVSAKCSDQCNIEYMDEQGNVIIEKDDYVPDFFPDKHYGDFVMLHIDIETGQILNWKKPTETELKKAMFKK